MERHPRVERSSRWNQTLVMIGRLNRKCSMPPMTHADCCCCVDLLHNLDWRASWCPMRVDFSYENRPLVLCNKAAVQWRVPFGPRAFSAPKARQSAATKRVAIRNDYDANCRQLSGPKSSNQFRGIVSSARGPEAATAQRIAPFDLEPQKDGAIQFIG